MSDKTEDFLGQRIRANSDEGGPGRRETIGWASIAALVGGLGSFVLAWITITNYLQGQIDRALLPMRENMAQFRADFLADSARARLDVNNALLLLRQDMQNIRENPRVEGRIDALVEEHRELKAHVEWWRQNGVTRAERLEMLAGLQSDISLVEKRLSNQEAQFDHLSPGQIMDQLGDLRVRVDRIERQFPTASPR